MLHRFLATFTRGYCILYSMKLYCILNRIEFKMLSDYDVPHL